MEKTVTEEKDLDLTAFRAKFKPFHTYRVTLRLKDIAGGIPAHPDLIEPWINATNKEKSEEERQKIIEAHKEDLPSVSEEKEARSTTTFKRDDSGLYIEARQVKAMMKEAGNILKDYLGVKALKSKVADQVFVTSEVEGMKDDHKIYLSRDKPDCTEERPVHAMTPQGPRSSLKRSDIVKDTEISFIVHKFDNKELTEDVLMGIFDFSQRSGLGADRSQDRGRFELVKITRLHKADRSLLRKEAS